MVEHGRKIKKTVIFAGYTCNNKCLFCINAFKRDLPSRKTEELMREMTNARQRGSKYLELIGGELTIRPDIVFLVRYAKKLGFQTVAIATNGRMFSYKKFAKEIVNAGIDHLIFSIHGHNSQVHDSLVQSSGSFQELVEGLKNLKRLKFTNIGSNTAIVKGNYKHIVDIGKFIYTMGIRNAEFIFVDPTYGGAHSAFKDLVPRISDAAPYVRRCLALGRGRKAKHWAVRYVPLCYFKDYLNQISELHEVALFTTEHIASDFYNADVERSRAEIARIKTEKCLGCKYYDICEGIWKEYLKYYGDSELSPIHA